MSKGGADGCKEEPGLKRKKAVDKSGRWVCKICDKSFSQKYRLVGGFFVKP